MNDFETRVLPVVVKYANRVLKDRETRQDAVGLCWFYYQQAEHRDRVTASRFANVGVWHALAGRRIPGEQSRNEQNGPDALDHPDTWRAGWMDGLADRRPGPDAIAERKETLQWMLANATPKTRRFLELALLGMETHEIADRLEVSAGRVSQMRREALERSQD